MERVTGLAAAFSLFAALPDAAQEEMKDMLTGIGQDILASEQQAVPVLTGALAAGLTVQMLLDRLRVRVGLIGLKGGRARLFYGRFVEFGRRAQTVLVRRRRPGTAGLRRGRKRAEDIAATYMLHVKARAAHPFVQIDRPARDASIDSRIAAFWSKTFDRAGV